MNILVVEDEEALNLYLQDSLKKEGYSVISISHIEELTAYIEQKTLAEPHIVVMDRLLNGVDSADYIPTFKHRFPAAKIIILSAIGGPSEKSRLLDNGADDYLAKPFSIEELSARIRVALRNNSRGSSTIHKYGNLTLNLLNQSADVEGKKVDLSRKEYQLLTALLHTPTRVFNRYQLLDTIWDVHTDVESNVVEVTIKNLRKKLESSTASIQILSKRNVGYWIEV